MDEVRRLAEQGAEDGTVVVADEQQAGRGRGGHAWFSPRGALLATTLIRPRVRLAHPPLLSLGASLSVARSIEKLLRVPARIKWPNDVWLGEKKVAGILADARSMGGWVEWMLVGVGVNGNVRLEEFPAEIQTGATSLSEHVRRHVCLPALLKVWLEDYERVLEDVENGRHARVLHDAGARLLFLGRRIHATTPTGSIEGVVERLGPAGELVVRTEQEEVPLREGECELVRPA